MKKLYMCLKCGAYCKEGHDDDLQIHCAECHNTVAIRQSPELIIREEDLAKYFIEISDYTWTAYKYKR